MKTTLLSLVLASAVLAAAPAVRKTAPRRPGAAPAALNTFGEISSVTSEAAFLNRGSVDGVSAGQAVTFNRGGKPAGTCKVTGVSEHFARCEGTGLKVGDRFAVGRGPELNPTAPAALPSDAELARRGTTLGNAEWTLRDFDGTSSSSGLATRVEALLSHTTYFGGKTSGFGVQRLDVAAYDVEIWKGLRVSADLTALNISARPADEARTVFRQTPVLLVHQLELGFRRADVPFSASVGRTWLRAATGLLVLDGAQASWRFGEGLELGAYGGLLPEAARLTITPSQWAAGAVAKARFSSGKGPEAMLVQVSARAGWSQRNVLGGRAEVALDGTVWRGTKFDANVGLELGFGQTQARVLPIDAARFEVGWRPSEMFRLNASLRYRGLPLTGLTEVGQISPGQRAIHGDLGAAYALSHWLVLAAQGGVASDFDSGLFQARVGPELTVPQVGPLPVALTGGYSEEFGWLRGRNGYFQVAVNATSLFRVIARGSYFQQVAASETTSGFASQEVGSTVALEVTPWRYLKARITLMGRLPVAGSLPAVPMGSISGQIGGSF
jgi:hypothetical protein